MSAGTSDSLHFRNAGAPSHGVDNSFAHGLDEKPRASKVAASPDFRPALLTRLAR
jgi:carboxypeptidase PM20D1